MAWNLYKHNDASAPVLTGTRGSLIALLDACLVNGYGPKAAAGWSKPYSDTNRAVYRMGSGRLRAFFKVDENTSALSYADSEARIRIWESMTGIEDADGTDPTPSTGYLIAKKSSTLNSTARNWWLVADDRTFVLFTQYDGTTTASGIYVGEFYSYTPNDNFGVAIIGRYLENSHSWTSTEAMGHFVYWGGSLSGSGRRVVRDGTGVLKAQGFSAVPGMNLFNPSFTAVSVAYPNPDDGSLILTPIFIHAETGGSLTIRGRLRGIWASPQISSMAIGDTFSGAGSIAGRSFIRVPDSVSNGGASYEYGVFPETSDTVERN